ncbi:MAG: hypothetical protein ACK5KN_05660 [Dysgonomonas sp.]|uniref:hypothetical protein n=1 Tax=Dysgonomonas sp. TaxID=1891233 RepID=UPI003A8892F5
MKRIKKTLQLFAVTGSLFFLTVFPLQSQVTIGAGIEPARAALLDLKDNDPDGENVTSKTGGLILARVKLVDKNTLEPFIPKTDPDWTNAVKQAALMKDHVGLMVYNLNDKDGFSEGTYIWNGAEWITFAEGSTPQPLNKIGTTTPSTANTDDSYLMAKLAVGANQAASVFGAGAQLTVVGPASINGMNVRGAGNGNTSLGVSTLNTSTGSDNTAVGYYAMHANTAGYGNTAVGSAVLLDNTTGERNTAIGSTAMRSNTTGGWNTAVGVSALYTNTEGNSNTAVGYEALIENETGNSNTAVGQYAMQNNTTGAYNTTVGNNAGKENIEGDYNTYVGDNAGGKATGDSNTFLGNNAGATQTSGNYNIAIGSDVNLPNTADNYQLNIGNAIYGVTTDDSNTFGRISIGKTAPDANMYLDVKTPGTSASPAPGFKLQDGNEGTGKVLTSDTNGMATWAFPKLASGAVAALPAWSTGRQIAPGQDAGVYAILNGSNPWSYTLPQAGTYLIIWSVNFWAGAGTTLPNIDPNAAFVARLSGSGTGTYTTTTIPGVGEWWSSRGVTGNEFNCSGIDLVKTSGSQPLFIRFQRFAYQTGESSFTGAVWRTWLRSFEVFIIQ